MDNSRVSEQSLEKRPRKPKHNVASSSISVNSAGKYNNLIKLAMLTCLCTYLRVRACIYIWEFYILTMEICDIFRLTWVHLIRSFPLCIHLINLFESSLGTKYDKTHA